MGWGFLLCGFIFDHLAEILRSVLVIMVLHNNISRCEILPWDVFLGWRLEH